MPSLRKDVRDVTPSDLEGVDAVIHLAALSNDPLSDLNPEVTYDVNHRKCRLGLVIRSVGLARARAKLGLANLVTNMRRLAWFEARPAPA